MEETLSQDKALLCSDETAITPVGDKSAIPLFQVSTKKLVIMFMATFGGYQLYWFYKQWQGLKKFYDLEAWPVARSFFAIFFTHSLFVYVNEYIKETQREYPWNHSGMASIYVWLIILAVIIDGVLRYDASSVALVIISMLMPLTVLYPLYKAQKAINFALEIVEHPINDSLTWLNWVWIVIGGLYWAMIITAMSMVL
jgi:hypothetical protein